VVRTGTFTAADCDEATKSIVSIVESLSQGLSRAEQLSKERDKLREVTDRHPDVGALLESLFPLVHVEGSSCRLTAPEGETFVSGWQGKSSVTCKHCLVEIALMDGRAEDLAAETSDPLTEKLQPVHAATAAAISRGSQHNHCGQPGIRWSGRWAKVTCLACLRLRPSRKRKV